VPESQYPGRKNYQYSLTENIVPVQLSSEKAKEIVKA